MIFKTFNNDIDKWTAKIGIFGKSFNELGTAINNAFEASIDNIDNFDENIGFWKTLKNNLAPKNENGDSWLKNSLEEIISADNINSYIAELDLTSAKDKLTEIFDWEATIKNGDATWQDYFDTLENGAEHYIPDVIKNTDDLSKLTGDDLVKANQQARQSALAHNEALKQQTLGAKAAKVRMQALATVGNMLAGIAIAKGIQLVADAIDHYVNRAKYAAEAMEEAQQKIDDAQNSLKNMSTILSENKDRFLELSQGVDRFSKNLRLSEEDYAEYLSISNELAELFPTLVSGYDEQGNALLSIGHNVDETNEKFQSLLETQQTVAQQTLIDNMDDVANGVYYEVEDAKNSIEEMENELTSLQQQYKKINIDIANSKGIISFSDDDYSKYGKAMEDALTSAGIEFKKDISAGLNNTAIQLISASPEQLTQAQKFYDAWLETENEYFHASENGLKKDIEEKRKSIENSYSKMTANLQAWLKDNYNYQYLSDSASNLVDALVPEIKWDELEAPPTTAWDYQNYVEENIIKPLMEVPQEHKQEIDNMFKKLLSFENGDLDVLTFAEELQTRLKELNIEIDITPIIADEQDVKNRLKNSIEAIAIAEDDSTNFITLFNTRVDIDDYNKLQEYTKDFGAEEQELWNKVTLDAKNAEDAINRYEEALKSVSDTNKITVSFSEAFNSADFSEQKEKLLDLAKSGELTEETLSSTEEYKTLLDDTGLSAELVKDKIYELLTAQEKLAGAHNGLDDLSNSYKEFKDLGFVTAQTLEGLPDVFKSLEGFDVFSQIVGNPESGVDAIQNAFNDIVKEYLLFTQTLNSDSLFGDNIEEQERAINTYIANLKQMGITNAEEVVKQTVSSMKQQQTLLDNAEQEYIDYLRGNEEDYMGYLKAKNNIDLQYIESTASYNSQFINSLGQGYETDYNNWLGLLRDKELAYQRYVKSLDGDGDGKFIYDPNKDVAGNLIANGKDASASNIVDFYTAKAEYERISKKYEDLRNTLSFNPVFSNNFSANWDGSSLSSGSGSKNSDNEFDWIETKLDILNDKLEKTKETAQDSFSDWIDRDKAFKDADKQIDDLIAKQKEAKARYLAEARKVGLTEKDENGISYTTLIQQGAIDIDKISNDTLKEKIQSYQEYWDKVKECDEAVIQLNKDSLQLDRDYREFKWEIFDYLQDSISRLTDEADYLIELLSNKDLFDNNGNLTKYADATLGLHISNYKTYMQKASDYAEEIKDLEKQLANGGQEVLDKYNERIDAHQDAILGAQQEKQAMLDLVEQGYQKQLDALNEAIDKKKELWNIEKGLFDYQQSIAEKTKNIAILEKRKFALSGDSSQEAKAQLQQIEVELSEARKDLEQTEYEKMISDTESMLDSLSD